MKTAPYIFVIIFIPVACYLMWNNFELPTFFGGETNKVKGKIESINLVYGIKGIGRYQEVTYYYSVNDSTYTDKFINKKYGIQKVGDALSIEYSVNNPQKNKVVGFYKHKNIEKIQSMKLQAQ